MHDVYITQVKVTWIFQNVGLYRCEEAGEYSQVSKIPFRWHSRVSVYIEFIKNVACFADFSLSAETSYSQRLVN